MKSARILPPTQPPPRPLRTPSLLYRRPLTHFTVPIAPVRLSAGPLAFCDSCDPFDSLVPSTFSRPANCDKGANLALLLFTTAASRLPLGRSCLPICRDRHPANRDIPEPLYRLLSSCCFRSRLTPQSFSLGPAHLCRLPTSSLDLWARCRRSVASKTALFTAFICRH